MQDAGPVTPVSPPSSAPTTPAVDQGDATDQFGLSFESLLEIVLTQLTYQDPLEPMDNYEFVSQLAQFSQIQLSQEMNDSLALLVSSQTSTQANALLTRTVDVAAGSTTLSGVVTAVSVIDGNAELTIETSAGQTISGLPLENVTQIRETP